VTAPVVAESVPSPLPCEFDTEDVRGTGSLVATASGDPGFPTIHVDLPNPSMGFGRPLFAVHHNSSGGPIWQVCEQCSVATVLVGVATFKRSAKAFDYTDFVATGNSKLCVSFALTRSVGNSS
jgi:hypothetical protein